MRIKSLLILVFGVYAGLASAQTNIDLSEIGAQAAQDCAESEECLVQESLANATSSDLSQYQSSALVTGAEYAAAAAGLAGAVSFTASSDSASNDNGISGDAQSGVEKVNSFGTQENGGFNQNKDNSQDLNRMDDEMLLLTLNQDVVATTTTDCDGQGLIDPINMNAGESCYCDTTKNRCYECNYATIRPEVPCVAFSYSEGNRPDVRSADDIDRGHYN